MSSEAITTVLPPRVESTQEERLWLLKLYDRFHPSQGWGSFVILLLALMVIGMSVEDGSWVPAPGLYSLLLIVRDYRAWARQSTYSRSVPASSRACRWCGACYLAGGGAFR